MINTTNLTTLAGTSLPILPTRRRGSVLVLAVGVLALMSIMVVVYVTLGQNDRRSGAASQARVQLTTQGQSVRDYLSQVIADGATAVVRQRDVLGNDHIVRKAWDYPSTDEQLISMNPGAPNPLRPTAPLVPGFNPAQWPARKFDPSGNVSTPWAAGSQTDPRTGGTPFLAAAEPTFLNFDGDDPTDPARLYIDYTDWQHISNFAPDGRFVNLAAIRGNFSAEVGLGVDGQNRPRTSELITLIDTAAAPGTSGRYDSTLDRDDPANPNRPADFTARQRGMARPMNDPRFIAGDPRRVDNQWRDNDGDGIADGRIFELIDASEPAQARAVVPEMPGLRTFVSARAIDLSGLINVNTARNDVRKSAQRTSATFQNGNATQPSDVLYPVGLTPADVNLERLLTLRDVFQNTQDPIEQIPQPTLAGSVARYEPIDVARATRIGESAFSSLLFASQRGSVGVTDLFTPGQVPTAPAFASQAYVTAGSVGGLSPLQRAEIYRVTGSDPSSGVVSRPAAATVTLGFSSTFGLADELELRTFNGRNNDATLSRLESALDGRSAGDENFGPMRSNRPLAVERSLTPDSATGALSEHDNPLDYRAQRALSNMDVRSKLTTISGDRPIATTILPPGASPLSLTDRELRLDISDAMSRVYVARDLPLDRGADPLPGQVVSAPVHAARLSAMTEAANAIFAGYADALLPFAGLTGPAANPVLGVAWNGATPAANNTRVLHYSGSRPGVQNNPAELALRSAAHMTLNLLASRYIPSTPVGVTIDANNPAQFAPRDTLFASTLLIDENARPQLEDNNGNPLPVPGNGLDTNTDSQPDFPYWRPFTSHRDDNVAFSIPLDLNRGVARTNAGLPVVSKLAIAPNNQNLTSRAVNIFAITPQPFVVGAATFTFYTDMWSGGGGDEEFEPGENGLEETRNPVSIEGGVRDEEPDFLFEYAVVQLHNPWSEPIALTSVDAFGNPERSAVTPQDFRYYIEFAGRTYKLAVDELSDPDAGTSRRGAVLLPGRSVNVIILPNDIDQIVARWRRAMGGTYETDRSLSVSQLPETIANMIRTQTRIDVDETEGSTLVTGILFDPADGRDVRFSEVSGQQYGFVVTAPFSSALPGDPDDRAGMFASNRVVRLWRRVDSPGVPRGQRIADVENAHWKLTYGNDYLVDRLRDPYIPSDDSILATLSPRLPSGEYRIAGTACGPDKGQGNLSAPRAFDNKGFTFVRFGSIFRSNDPGSLTPPNPGNTPIGAVPAYCLEVKSNIQPRSGPTIKARLSLNDATPDSPHTDTPDQNYFSGGSPDSGLYGQEDVGLFVRALASDAAEKISDRLVDGPRADPDVTINKPGDNISGGGTGRGQDYNERYIQIVQGRRVPASDNGSTGSPPVQGDLPPMLSVDLLRPLAVGPWHDPLLRLRDVTAPLDPRNLDAQWTTLSEALALASDYDEQGFELTATLISGGSREISPNEFVYFAAGRADFTDPSGKKVINNGAFDRGQLFIDRFIPFNDLNNDGRFTQSPNAATSDPHLGLGIPFALNILNNFRTQPYGSLQQVYQGRVNINTAPLNVLRAVGMLSPDIRGWASGDSDVYGNTDSRLADPLYSATQSSFDLAGTLIAYRDKARVRLRPVGTNFNSRLVADYRDNNENNASGDAFGPGDDNGRRTAAFIYENNSSVGTPNTIEPIRETPGFQSIGEVLAARLRGDFSPVGASQSATENADMSIDRLSRIDPISPADAAGSDAGLFGFLSDYYAPTSQPHTMRVGSVPNSWQRQLDIAASAIDTLTVRSDIFGVWFTVMGFTPSDVEGLAPLTVAPSPATEEDPRFADPMVPSFERRYFMVVDRSNVTTRGQKPRILLFQELPSE